MELAVDSEGPEKGTGRSGKGGQGHEKGHGKEIGVGVPIRPVAVFLPIIGAYKKDKDITAPKAGDTYAIGCGRGRGPKDGRAEATFIQKGFPYIETVTVGKKAFPRHARAASVARPKHSKGDSVSTVIKADGERGLPRPEENKNGVLRQANAKKEGLIGRGAGFPFTEATRHRRENVTTA